MKKLALALLLFNLNFILLNAQTVTVANDGSGNYNCNGSNDEIEINQALDDINSQGGGTVLIKAGTYTIDNQIKIHSNTIFKGIDFTQTIIKIQDWSTISNEVPFIINSNFNNYVDSTVNDFITITDLTFDGNRLNNEDDDHWAGDSWHTAFAFLGTNNITFNNVNVINNLNDAFQFENCNITNITNCSTSNIGHDAIYYIYSQNLIAEDNIFDLAADAGVRTDNSNHILIKDNYIFDKDGYGGNAIEIAYRGQDTVMDDLIIEGNIIEQAPMSGITLYSDDPSITNGVIIRNNIIYQVGTTDGLTESAGINITNFDNTIIQNNSIYNCVGSGIRFGSEWYYTNSETPRTATITNNIISQNTVFGGDNVYGIEVLDATTVTSNYNNIWENKSGNYFGCSQGANDISSNPIFTNAPYNDDSGNNPYFNNVDLHLQSTSPCIDTGLTISLISEDLDGNPRPNGASYDIGAYEYSEVNSVIDNIFNKIDIFPNPTNSVIYISNQLLSNKYIIISILGNNVKNGIIKSDKIDLSELNSGVYYLIIEGSNQQINIGKIIKE